MSNEQIQGLQKENTSPVVNSVSDDELTQVKKLFASLLLSVKNLSLYPQGHNICITSIGQFYTQLTVFLNKYGSLKLEVERERIICRGEVISLGAPEEATLHFTLFRDGVRWLEFIAGIEQKEINGLLLIIKKYIKLSAEPEGDIATALWEINFPHIHYEIADFFMGGGLETGKFNDLTTGKSSPIQNAEPEWREKEYPHEPEIDLTKVKLTPTEQFDLLEMIGMEEDADLTSYLDALLDSLLQQKEENGFRNILDVFSEEFTLSLSRKDFTVTLKILQGLFYVKDFCGEELLWAGKLIDDFILNISSAKSLVPLKDTWVETDPEDAEILREIFMHLNHRVIKTLVSLIPLTQPAPLSKMLLDLILQIASRDKRALEWALSEANEHLLERLIPVIERMDKAQAIRYLVKLSHQPSGRIRYEAVKSILKIEPVRVRDMLDLIDDNDNSLRQLVIEQMGHSRDEVVEEFLISYIKKNKSNNTNNADHMMQCFRILGKCGSLYSVPFLRETLLKWGFLSGSRRTLLRRGAALALCNLDIIQAGEVLDRAGRSLFPGVRGIVDKTMKELNEEADSSDR